MKARWSLLHITSLAACIGLAGALLGSEARAEDRAEPAVDRRPGMAHVSEHSREPAVTSDQIKSAAASGAMTRVWETLEHGERVECLDCIPSVEPLLFDNNPRTREIAAWWLRRRAFGVFGPGQVYQRLLDRLGKDADPRFRAYAADAVGEFLSQAGEAPLALALQSDADMSVRAAAARALGRMNSDGKGALSVALGTADAQVRSAALQAAGLVNGFSDVAAVVRTLDDGDAAVRLRAVKLLDQMKATDSVAALVRLVQSDPAANVRGAAAHALGTIGDKSARTALETVAQSDADSLVRDQARFSLRGL